MISYTLIVIVIFRTLNGRLDTKRDPFADTNSDSPNLAFIAERNGAAHRQESIQGGPERMQHLRSQISKNQRLNQISECINE